MGSADIKNLFNIVGNGSTSSLSDFLKEISQTVDVSLRSFVNQRNEQNRTVLHSSCSKLFPNISQILLEAGADPNVQDLDGRTPIFLLVVRLHECNCENCLRKAIRCLANLAFHGGSLDIPDGNDFTPLYLCAEYHFVDFARALLENGAALGTVYEISNNIDIFNACNHLTGRPIIEVLAEKVPGVMEIVLDRAVKLTGSKAFQDPDLELMFDLGVLLPAQVPLNSPHAHSNLNGSSTANQVFPAEQWFSEKYEATEEMTFLKSILDCSGHDYDSSIYKCLVRHPLVNVFTDIKWKSLEAIYYAFLLMQIKILFAYSAFICATIFLDCPYDLYVSIRKGLNDINSQAQQKGIPLGADFNASYIINPDQLCEINIISKILSVLVFGCTLIILMKEVQHAMYDMKDYLKDIFNYFQLGGFVSVIFTVIIAWDQHSPLYSLLYPVAAFGITLSWCQIFVQIGRLPQLAIYIEMFVKICANFYWSLTIYSFLFIGFAMSYIILFIEKPMLRDIPLSLVKVLTMLVGELDYAELFKDEESGQNNSTSSDSIGMLLTSRRFAGRVWYVNFVIFITLVLMNLLVGLAVSDIQGIRKNAEIFVIKRRIRYIAYLEKSLFEATSLLPAFIKKFIRGHICVAKPGKAKHFRSCFTPLCTSIEVKGCKIGIFPNNLRRYPYLSHESKASIRHWLCKKSASFTTRKCQMSSNTNSGFRQRNLSNFRKESTTSFIAPPLFIKDSKEENDSDRIKKLEFNVQQMDNKISELDIKLDTILKVLMRPEND